MMLFAVTCVPYNIVSMAERSSGTARQRRPVAHSSRGRSGEGLGGRADRGADLYDEWIFRPVDKADHIAGAAIVDEKAIWQVVLKYGRTCAKLCRRAEGAWNKIRLLPRTRLGFRPPSSTSEFSKTWL